MPWTIGLVLRFMNTISYRQDARAAAAGNGSAASPIRSGIPLLRGTSSEGGSVRGSPCDVLARLRFTSASTPSCVCYAGNRGPGAMRGVPRSGLWSESSDFASGTGSERAKVASVAEGNPPRARALPLEAASPGGVPVGVRRFRFGVPVPVALPHGKSVRGVGQP